MAPFNVVHSQVWKVRCVFAVEKGTIISGHRNTIRCRTALMGRSTDSCLAEIGAQVVQF